VRPGLGLAAPGGEWIRSIVLVQTEELPFRFAMAALRCTTCPLALLHRNQSGLRQQMKKILVIEEEPEMRRNLTTVLRLERFNPLSAENGRIGVELAKKEKPDLILCDVTMPEPDGYSVIAQLRADREIGAIPLIFLGAKGENPEMGAGTDLGAGDYLTIPVMKLDLLSAIRSRLEKGRGAFPYREQKRS
jgi:DNA-binding response OmpR family regulator